MVGLGGDFQHCQFDVGTQRRKEVVALGGHCAIGFHGLANEANGLQAALTGDAFDLSLR